MNTINCYRNSLKGMRKMKDGQMKVQGQENKKKAMNMQPKAMETYGKTRKCKDLEGEDDSSKERIVAPWCSGYHYCTTSFTKA